MQLEQALREMHSFLRGEKTANEMVEQFGEDTERWAVYQRFVKNHIVNTLDRNFSTMASLLGEKIWNILREDYFLKCPAHDWRLIEGSRKFPDYLKQLHLEQKYGIQKFHLELAQFEWEEMLAYSNENVIPGSQEVKIPTLNPTISVLQLEYAIVEFVIAWRKKLDKEWIKNKSYLEKRNTPEVVFVFRNPKTLRSNYCEATEPLLFAFKIVHDGISLEQAAEISGHPLETIEQVMQNAADMGIIVLGRQKK